MLEGMLAYEAFLGAVAMLVVVTLMIKRKFLPALVITVTVEIGAVLLLVFGPEYHRDATIFSIRWVPVNVLLGLGLTTILIGLVVEEKRKKNKEKA